MAAPVDIVLGIDVAKAQLDVAVWPTEDNRAALAGAGVARALQPAAGSHGRVRARRGGRPSVVVVKNPRLRAHGTWPRIGAQVLARFAADVRPPAAPGGGPAPAGPVRERRQLVELRVATQHRRRQVPPARRPRRDAHLALLRAELRELDWEVAAALQADPQLQSLRQHRHRPRGRRHLAGRSARSPAPASRLPPWSAWPPSRPRPLRTWPPWPPRGRLPAARPLQRPPPDHVGPSRDLTLDGPHSCSPPGEGARAAGALALDTFHSCSPGTGDGTGRSRGELCKGLSREREKERRACRSLEAAHRRCS